MAPRKPRGAAALLVSAARVRRLTDSLDRVVHALDAQASLIEENRKDLHLQFRRIAQIQAELDVLKQTIAKLTGRPNG